MVFAKPGCQHTDKVNSTCCRISCCREKQHVYPSETPVNTDILEILASQAGQPCHRFGDSHVTVLPEQALWDMEKQKRPQAEITCDPIPGTACVAKKNTRQKIYHRKLPWTFCLRYYYLTIDYTQIALSILPGISGTGCHT